jgi:hypothetical protein
MSQYMLLIYTDAKRWEDVGEEVQNAVTGEYYTYTEALTNSGALVAGEALQGVETAKTVAQNGVVTDGPFAETTEHLGGYYLIDVETMDEAIEWAGRIPGVPRGLDRVEVRPIMVFE